MLIFLDEIARNYPNPQSHLCVPGVYDKNTAIKFGNQVGWRRRGSWLNYSQFNFSFNINVPQGHLPGVFYRVPGFDIWQLHSCKTL